jgi:hypothetical protein
MDHATVVAGLMGGKPILFFQHQQLEMGVTLHDLQGGRQSNDTAPDDGEIELFCH